MFSRTYCLQKSMFEWWGTLWNIYTILQTALSVTYLQWMNLKGLFNVVIDSGVVMDTFSLRFLTQQSYWLLCVVGGIFNICYAPGITCFSTFKWLSNNFDDLTLAVILCCGLSCVCEISHSFVKPWTCRAGIHNWIKNYPCWDRHTAQML